MFSFTSAKQSTSNHWFAKATIHSSSNKQKSPRCLGINPRVFSTFSQCIKTLPSLETTKFDWGRMLLFPWNFPIRIEQKHVNIEKHTTAHVHISNKVLIQLHIKTMKTYYTSNTTYHTHYTNANYELFRFNDGYNSFYRISFRNQFDKYYTRIFKIIN